MAAKSANLYARIEPQVKEQAEAILSSLGVSASSAVNMFYKQIVLHRGLPFDVKLPVSKVPDISSMDVEELDAELQKGYSDMQSGRVRPAGEFFRELGNSGSARRCAELKYDIDKADI